MPRALSLYHEKGRKQSDADAVEDSFSAAKKGRQSLGKTKQGKG